jgi:hypothetical protein
MTNKVRRVVSICLVVGGYLSLLGIGILSALRRKGKASSSMESTNPTEHSEPTLQSATGVTGNMEGLSRSTPGDAPLDRISRIAAREQREEPESGHSKLNIFEPPGCDDPPLANEASVGALLQHQSLNSYRLEAWSISEPKRLPVPTYAPAVMAFGIVLFAMGLATTWYVCVAGSLVFAVAAWRWVGELQGE